jgi:hypothetical protein
MPNGRRRSQRTRAANQRRNRDRDRRSAAAAAAEVRQASDTVAGLLHHTVVQGTADDVSACPPLSAMDGNPSEVVEALRRIQDWEIKCSVVDCSAVLAALASKGLPSAIVDCLRELALSRREKITAPACEIVAMMLSNLRKGNIAVPLITEDLVEPLVQSLRIADWHGITANDVGAWIELLNVHGTPKRVTDAVTSCFTAHLKRVDPDASSSSSSSDEDEFVDVQEEEELCTSYVQQHAPEPQAIDCMVCCAPTAPCMLITCDQDTACEYRQCIDCVVKGGGAACTTPGCMTMHHTCPACRGHCGGIKLTDDRLSKAHLLSVIDTGRERNQNAIDRHMEEMDETMREMNRRIGELCSKSFGL